MGNIWDKFRGWPLWAQLAAGVVVAIVVIGAFSSEEPEPSASPTTTETTEATTTTAGPTTTTNPVIERINSTDDCTQLQDEFDTAMGNVDRYESGDDRRKLPLSYAEAADNRMREVGCY